MSVTKDTEVFLFIYATEWRLIENEFKDWKWAKTENEQGVVTLNCKHNM